MVDWCHHHSSQQFQVRSHLLEPSRQDRVWVFGVASSPGVDRQQMGLTQKVDVLLYRNIVQQGIVNCDFDDVYGVFFDFLTSCCIFKWPCESVWVPRSTGTRYLSWKAKSILDLAALVHYFWPLDSIRIKEFDNVWNEVTRQSRGRLTFDTIPVMFGRYTLKCSAFVALFKQSWLKLMLMLCFFPYQIHGIEYEETSEEPEQAAPEESEQQEVKEAEDKETLVDTRQELEPEPEPEEEEVPPLISTDQTKDLLDNKKIVPMIGIISEEFELSEPPSELLLSESDLAWAMSRRAIWKSSSLDDLDLGLTFDLDLSFGLGWSELGFANLVLIFDLDDLGLEELDDGLPRLTGGISNKWSGHSDPPCKNSREYQDKEEA
ncbi:hypothetical protein HYC85_030281 [Camellia sinensis]|uniref:Uncharacterized protein n=1 Tax=Camellia sinensis TaxID=4442 RepID=A0A7J7G0A0_CAMSI|nr:hypothetical protein HYC85_030281 [Camellia sinensis]